MDLLPKAPKFLTFNNTFANIFANIFATCKLLILKLAKHITSFLLFCRISQWTETRVTEIKIQFNSISL